jgi:hypothetical protein
MSKKILPAFFIFLFSSLIIKAQNFQPQLISGNYQQVSFEKFAKDIESKTSYRFFFDPTDTDSLLITVAAGERSLESILKQVFFGTELLASIDKNGHVFITKGIRIQTDLPLNFFKETEEVAVQQDKPTEAELERVREKRIANAEVKLYEIGVKTANPTGNAILEGLVKNTKTGEVVIGAAVYIENPRIGVMTDQFGHYTINLPKGQHVLIVKSIGMKDTKRNIALYSDGKLNVEMQEHVMGLKEVVVEAEKAKNVSGMQMGQEKINIKTIKQIPMVFGEADIVRVVMTLPGVKTVGEATTGFNVRGGSTDQNLILFNDAVIYNPTHLFGFFSAFNSDIISTVELYKSNIPSKYGGRLSSVLEVNTRDGNKKKIVGSGGLGLLTGRLAIEGPIVNEKTSFIIAGRTTYSNWLLGQLKNSAYKGSKASFYDLNLQLTHQLTEKDNLYLTGYFSSDKFRLKKDTAFAYSNKSAVLRWKHTFNNKIFMVTSTGYSGYNYEVSSEENPVEAAKLKFDINQYHFKTDFSYFLSSKHTLDFGLSSIYYKLHPGSYNGIKEESQVVPKEVEQEQGLESAIYLGDRFEVTPRFSIQAGIRFSMFNFLGPKQVYSYPDGGRKETFNITDTTNYEKGDFIKNYYGPEYRVATRYLLTDNLSIKASYNTLRQYIHMLSNTTAISPTDIWKLSDPNIKPTTGDQISLGIYKNFKSNSIETSVEVYHRNMKDYLDYKGGAVLILNKQIETDVLHTIGKAYGVEFLVKKVTGKLNGWFSYTYSRTLLKMNNPNEGELINKGKWYPANYDKPHDFTLIGNYKFSHRFNTSLNFTYSTGRPITLPLAKYNLAGSDRVFYSERNQYRIPDYYRVDFSMNIEGNHKIKKLAHSSWTIAVYNLLGRRNAYSVFFKSENGVVKGYKLSIFGQPIPTLTYNFRF